MRDENAIAIRKGTITKGDEVQERATDHVASRACIALRFRLKIDVS